MKSFFVSSTFRDFQQERDVLNQNVLPLLNEKALVFGESVDFCDLRWGVDTSKMSEAKANQAVLSVCLNEIDRSSPRMIVLIGGRYGYVPGENEIRKQLRKRADFILEDLSISVTQLEVEYGAMRKGASPEHVYFYVRELSGEAIPEHFLEMNPEYKKKLEALKTRILKIGGDHVRFYTAKVEGGRVGGLEAFQDMVLQDCMTDLTPEWERYEKLSVFDREREIQKNRREELTRAFIYPEKVAAPPALLLSAMVKKLLPKEYYRVFMDKEEKQIFKELRSRISNEDVARELLADPINSLILPGTIKYIHSFSDEAAASSHRGAHGSGKTMFAVHLHKILHYMGWKVETILCGSSPMTSDAAGVQRYLAYILEQWTGEHMQDLEKLSPEALRNYCNELVTQKLQKNKEICRYCVIIDGVDRLQDTELRNTFGFLPSKYNVLFRVFMTLGPDFKLPRENEETQRQSTFVPEAFTYQMIRQVMHSTGKQLGEPVQEAIASKEGASNPLYVKMAAERLCMMSSEDFEQIRSTGDGMEAINQYQEDLVNELPDSLEGMVFRLLSAAARSLALEGMQKAMDYLTISRNGLRKEDMIALLAMEQVTITGLDVLRYVNYLGSFFMIREDGFIDFKHAVFRKGVGTTMNKQMKAQLRRNLIIYMEGLPEQDPLRENELLIQLREE